MHSRVHCQSYQFVCPIALLMNLLQLNKVTALVAVSLGTVCSACRALEYPKHWGFRVTRGNAVFGVDWNGTYPVTACAFPFPSSEIHATG